MLDLLIVQNDSKPSKRGIWIYIFWYCPRLLDIIDNKNSSVKYMIDIEIENLKSKHIKIIYKC